MQPSEYENLARHESTYWWFVAKRKLLRHFITTYNSKSSQSGPMLDIGCGPGGNLALLRSFTPHVIGFDYSPDALKFARQQDVQLGQVDILHVPLMDNCINLITLLDVLYHQWISNDQAALAESYRILKPGGILILTDSAFSFLRGPHDETNLTARRYTVPEMRAKLTHLGFEIKKQSYVYALLFPLAFARRWFQRTFAAHKLPASDIQPLPGWLNDTFLGLFSLEFAWLKRVSLPIGTSILFVAQKPTEA